MKKVFQLFTLILVLYSCDEKFDHTIDDSLYQISFNNIWSIEESEFDTIEFYLVGNDSINRFCNINLDIQNLREDQDFKTFIETSEKSLTKNEKLISSKYKSGFKMNYQEMIFEADYGEFSLMFLQRFILKDSKMYVLTYACEEVYFDSNIDESNKTFDSFTIK